MWRAVAAAALPILGAMSSTLQRALAGLREFYVRRRGASPVALAAPALEPTPDADDSNWLEPHEIAFVFCAEANRLEPQARLLCASIRRFGGRYRHAPIYAVSPRSHLALSPASQAALTALGAQCVSLPLNETGSPYGSINRIVVGAWAETHLPQPYLVLLDTDMLFVDEPGFVRADVGVRPVDMKGSATTGEGDPMDPYWARLCALAGIELSRLPRGQTTMDQVGIRASYNGGFTVVRRELGVLRRTRDIFFASFEQDLRPQTGVATEVKASTGLVGQEASEWWGSSQAALSIAIWSLSADVRVYDSRYNIPGHILADPSRVWALPAGRGPVLLHYHYLAEPTYQAHLDEVMRRLGCTSEVMHWTRGRLPWFDAQAREAVCFCTLAIHAPYRRRARQLCDDVAGVDWVVLTDEPADFQDMPLRAIPCVPTGPMAVDYVARQAPTGGGRGTAAYHDKRFALAAALERHQTALFLDADSRFTAVPRLTSFPPGIAVLPLVRRSVAEHLQAAGAWRLPAFMDLARELTGDTEILARAPWCHEACIAITRDGRESAFFDAWDRAAQFMQAREVFSGEGGVIGIAATLAGWTVHLDALDDIDAVLRHEGGGPKVA